jgi:hypothetical protein
MILPSRSVTVWVAQVAHGLAVPHDEGRLKAVPA